MKTDWKIRENQVISCVNILIKNINRYRKISIREYGVNNRELTIKKGYFVERDGQIVIFNG